MSTSSCALILVNAPEDHSVPNLIRTAFFVTLCGTLSAAQNTNSSPSPSPQGEAKVEAAGSDFAAARRLTQQGKYDEAIAQLQTLAVKSPGRPGVSHELGTAYYKKGDYLKAAEYLKQAMADDPNDKEAVQLLGLSYYLAGRPAEAIPYLEKVQTWYPRANVDASYVLGTSYIQSKDYPNARKAFAKMFDVPPDSGAAYLFTARMLFRQEFLPIAEEYAQKAITSDPKLPLAHQLLGEIHMFNSKIPEAISDFEQELVLNPGYPATYYKLGDAYSRVQKWDDAERQLQRSIWLDASSTGPYILLGKVLEKKGEAALAVRYLQHAATMDPNNPMTHQLLGQAYRDVGRADAAEQELKVAEQLRNKLTDGP
jgi:tetratricopeptide (TPR) repeat protein